MPPLPPRDAPKLSEGDVRKNIELALNKQGLVWVRPNQLYKGYGEGGRYVNAGLGTGTADLIGLVLGPGRFFAVEVKLPKGKLSPEQKAFRDMIIRFGGYACVARTPEEACLHAKRASEGKDPE